MQCLSVTLRLHEYATRRSTGKWTEETQMQLATLVRSKQFDFEAVAKSLAAEVRSNRMRDACYHLCVWARRSKCKHVTKNYGAHGTNDSVGCPSDQLAKPHSRRMPSEVV